MRVKLDIELCQGHGICVGEAPGFFELDPGTDHVVVLQESPPEAARQAIENAVRYCPTFALSLEE